MNGEGRRNDGGAAASIWSSRRVADRQQQHAKSSTSHAGSSISASPMRQARLKPVGAVPLELLSSPSRGLDAGADPSQDLTNAATQLRFRQHISERIEAHAKRFGPLHHSSHQLFPIPLPGRTRTKGKERADALDGPALQSLQEIMLLVRKLREGCVAASRSDDFTLDTYLTSTLCSILIGDNIQLGSSMPRAVELFEQRASSDESVEWQACRDMHNILHGTPTRHTPSVTVTLDLVRALHLLWLSVSGGQAERLGGAAQSTHQRRRGTSLAYHVRRQHIATPGERVRRADRFNSALARDDVVALRALLIETSDDIWERALLRRIVEAQRATSWATLRKAYVHLAIDGTLLGTSGTWPACAGPSDWLERMLLIDLELVSLQDGERPASTAAAPVTAPPDAWDEVDSLGTALQATTLHDDPALHTVRANRIAAVLSLYELPTATSSMRLEGCSEALNNWRGRIVTQAGAPVMTLR